jgi:hypothetical protein
MGVLNWITQGCDALTTTASPTIDALGLHICIALATIMLVWFGVQESLASAHGGTGFQVGKFLSFFMLITFAYTLVRFYDSSIPGMGNPFAASSTAARSISSRSSATTASRQFRTHSATHRQLKAPV